MIRIQPKFTNRKMPHREIVETSVGFTDMENGSTGLNDIVVNLLHSQLYITDAQVKEATLHANMNGTSILFALQRLYHITDEEISMMVASIYGMEFIGDLCRWEFLQDALDAVPADVCRKWTIIPIDKNGSIPTIAICDPSDLNLLDTINKTVGCVDVVVSTRSQIQSAILKYYA